MGIDYRGFAIPKPRARVWDRIAKRLQRLREERACRLAVAQRDQGRCRICGRRGRQLHHVVPRSRGGRWLTSNLVTLCVDHHQMVHAALIEISGNADGELIVTGDVRLQREPL
jgi:5-methylcytosine-specific restriction endonuclease McrA